MIYLNNAATSWPKPQCVLNAHAAALSSPPHSRFRGGGDTAGDSRESCREGLSQLLKVKQKERIFFCSGATEGLNTLLCGLNLEGKELITTVTEHNSVLRPLCNQQALKDKVRVKLIPCDAFGRVSPSDVEAAIGPLTGAVFINHCSNVTGAVQDMRALGEIAGRHGLIFLADLSQSAGSVPVDVDGCGIDGFAFAGHKSLYGVQGTGGFYLREGIFLRPLLYGGTGRDSRRLFYGEAFEEGTGKGVGRNSLGRMKNSAAKGNGLDGYEYEAGTGNTPGIAALCAGVDYILGQGMDCVVKKERALWNMLYERLRPLSRVKIIGSPDIPHGPVMSFLVEGYTPADVAYILNSGYGIAVRAGLHCAPLIHKYLGTDAYGTVRVGISEQNTPEDVECLAEALRALNDA